MLKTSEVARKLNITNRQVQDLVDFGYLPIADTYRTNAGGFGYLFSEQALESLDDVPSLLAEIKDRKRGRRNISSSCGGWRRRQKVLERSERFLCSTADLPEAPLLRAAFYLFHLNHYAKTYQDEQKRLYELKNQVLAHMMDKFSEVVECIYLVGDDQVKVWLCDDCRQAANAAGYSYPEYVREGRRCSKCYVQVLAREYYSLIEYNIEVEECRFCFHLPYPIARKWMDIEELPRRERKQGKGSDEMYFYGRKITRMEERVVPLAVVERELEEFLRT